VPEDLDQLHRAEWGRLLSALIRSFGDFDLAEEALQDAFTSAVTEWAAGAPANPRAWLYTAARHNAIDQIRRRARFAEKQALIAVQESAEVEIVEEDAVPDERLRLIFTCCHPSLGMEAQVALTLRTLCGLKTEEIARAFLVPATTMAQRLVRAKKKITAAAIPYRVPGADELEARLAGVMAVIYLVFNEGYAATAGDALVRRELCAEAIRLARLLRALMSAPIPELDALLALMLITDSRRNARVDNSGDLVLLADQDRALWDHAQIEEGLGLIRAAVRRGPAGPYTIEAAIAALHTEPETDWPQIAGLYGRLFALHPSPVVALNRAVAISMARGPDAALPLLDAIAEALEEYHLFHATRADLLRRLGRTAEALEEYRRAHALAQNDVERRFLAKRIAECA
jgi:RNA polymerase sigma-70 factor (ECF subfamily)